MGVLLAYIMRVLLLAYIMRVLLAYIIRVLPAYIMRVVILAYIHGSIANLYSWEYCWLIFMEVLLDYIHEIIAGLNSWKYIHGSIASSYYRKYYRTVLLVYIMRTLEVYFLGVLLTFIVLKVSNSCKRINNSGKILQSKVEMYYGIRTVREWKKKF